MPSLPHLTHYSIFFFFTAPSTTEIYTLSLHDALPIYFMPVTSEEEKKRRLWPEHEIIRQIRCDEGKTSIVVDFEDRKSTRLNSSHVEISYAVFCLKKKKKIKPKEEESTTVKRIYDL